MRKFLAFLGILTLAALFILVVSNHNDWQRLTQKEQQHQKKMLAKLQQAQPGSILTLSVGSGLANHITSGHVTKIETHGVWYKYPGPDSQVRKKTFLPYMLPLNPPGDARIVDVRNPDDPGHKQLGGWYFLN